ncbi:MAG: hypothetical protein K0R92_3176 [Lachnospiraceae bacterium]|jgi:hypothetical protein|nr:hypothetical protein [Lachnospiraceae bacterium]MDF2845177.1 hypothetical protein [Herbinix sp.]
MKPIQVTDFGHTVTRMVSISKQYAVYEIGIRSMKDEEEDYGRK